ncbi:hypothetical protein [Paenibacillus roseipurpureus]|uniref:Glycoside hydrolase family 42 N-terminal domain-containing protein n=1 Tax=Paenibacillus roseopurpureus TaxID=2918901 RepID=A0AA96LR93_9BACL|nr:hypothetical protein [Paenibacillus sp. MBLB1832]WNR45749.1 hypothetical protein MJB10_06510 [Paenibacillus sp. MBLB1832]
MNIDDVAKGADNMQLFKASGDLQLEQTEEGGWLIHTGEAGGRIVALGLEDFVTNHFLELELENRNSGQLTLQIEFHLQQEPGEEEQPPIRLRTSFLPMTHLVTSYDLQLTDNQLAFLPRSPGRLKSLVEGRQTDRSLICGLVIRILPFHKPQRFVIHRLRLSPNSTIHSVRAVEPILDKLGQLKNADWSNKLSSESDMISRLRDELFAAKEDKYDRNRNAFGGFVAKRFRATGYFRVDQDKGGRWWLVDPDGCGFFSVGLDGVRPGEYGMVTGLEPLFDWLPNQDDPLYKDAWQIHEPTSSSLFSFAIANLIRAFGEEWKTKWIQLTRSRLKEWGVNTVANWSHPDFIKQAGMPYVYPLAGFPRTERCIFRDFPDVFSEEYRQLSEIYAVQLEALREDRLLIGYFMSNEPNWAYAGHMNLAREMFRSSYPFASKSKLLEYLRAKYEDNLSLLNAEWRTELASFEDIMDWSHQDFQGKADEDLFEFTGRMIEQFVKVPALELKKVDPHHLNLGMRYAWISTELVLNGCAYFDVFSLNCYGFEPNLREIALIYERTGKPVLIGEYHFGAPDAGLPTTGLKSVANQEERGKAYRYYVEKCAEMSEVLGMHYFILNDQSFTGRLDGECSQIGIVDGRHKPYPSMVQFMRQTHSELYDILIGAKPSEAMVPIRIESNFF